MGKAVKMGAFQGANGLLNPDAPITREEAFTVLARAFALEGGGSATLKDFVDGGTVSSRPRALRRWSQADMSTARTEC